MDTAVTGRYRILFQAVQGQKNGMAVCEFVNRSNDRRILLRTRDETVQRNYLHAFGERYPIIYRDDVLEAFLPYHEGQSFNFYERENEPDFSRRRQICLSILEGIIESGIPADIVWLMSAKQNIVICKEGARLQYFLDFSRETKAGVSSKEVYSDLALLFFDLLNTCAGMTEKNHKQFPQEYQLLKRRAVSKEYRGLDQLCKDIAALPEQCAAKGIDRNLLKEWRNTVQAKIPRWATAILMTLLVAFAIFCAVGKLIQSMEEVPAVFSGIAQIGDQKLTSG